MFSLHSLPSAGCNSFSLPSPEGPVHQHRPWHCHLPVQRGLDWEWQGLCAHRQLHAGEQRELPPQRRLRLHRARTGMSRAGQPGGGLTQLTLPQLLSGGLGWSEVKIWSACLSTARNTSCSIPVFACEVQWCVQGMLS